MEIAGDYTRDASSPLLVEIGSLTPETGYDVVWVIGTSFLDGTLRVDLFDLGSGPFAPSAGDAFDVLSAEVVSRFFDTVTSPGLGAGLVWQTSVPEDAFGTTDVLRLRVGVPRRRGAQVAWADARWGVGSHIEPGTTTGVRRDVPRR